MPVVLLWAVPAVIVFGGVGHYLMSIADLIDAAFNLETPPIRRRKFKVIEGGRA